MIRWNSFTTSGYAACSGLLNVHTGGHYQIQITTSLLWLWLDPRATGQGVPMSRFEASRLTSTLRTWCWGLSCWFSGWLQPQSTLLFWQGIELRLPLPLILAILRLRPAAGKPLADVLGNGRIPLFWPLLWTAMASRSLFLFIKGRCSLDCCLRCRKLSVPSPAHLHDKIRRYWVWKKPKYMSRLNSVYAIKCIEFNILQNLIGLVWR